MSIHNERSMRGIRLFALVSLMLALPLSRAAAQTCQGMASFQDGRKRIGFDGQANSDFNGVRGTFEYGVPNSIYGGISLGGLHVARPGLSGADVGLHFGYQIPLSDTPFQFCPAVSGHYLLDGASQTSQEALGGSLGYRLSVSDWFTVVPAAGVWFISTRTTTSYVLDVVDVAPDPSAARGSTADNGMSNQVFVTVGLVFKKAFTISPGLIIPSQYGAKPIYTLGLSMNWSNPVSR